jgi:hypothetical protein
MSYQSWNDPPCPVKSALPLSLYDTIAPWGPTSLPIRTFFFTMIVASSIADCLEWTSFITASFPRSAPLHDINNTVYGCAMRSKEIT